MTATRELSFAVVVAGVVLALFFVSTNLYLGLTTGTTIVSSISSAVLAMLAFSRFRGNAILRANAVQTAATSGEGLAYGMLFGVPMLLVIHDIEPFEIAIIVGLGGVLGVLFTIPLRRALIVERALQFPEGVATAEVLQVQPSRTGLRELVVASSVAAVAKLGAQGLGLWSAWAGLSQSLRNGNIRVDIGIFASPGGAAVGFLIGANLALVAFAGAVCSLVAGTAYLYVTLPDGPQSSFVPATSFDYARQIPVGALVVGGLWSLIRLRGRVTSAFAARRRAKNVVERERDLSLKIVGPLLVLVALALALLMWRWTGSVTLSLIMAVGIVVVTFALAVVAGHAAGLVGASNFPLSGLVFVGAIVFELGSMNLSWSGAMGDAGAIAIAVIACATAVAASNLQALRAGYLVGATPWKQQIMQVVGVIVAAASLPFLLQFVEPDSLGQSRILDHALRPLGVLSIRPVAIGAGLAIAVILIDWVLQRTRRTVRAPVMAFAVGTFLSVDLAAMIAIGGVVAWWVERFLDRTNAGADEREAVRRRGSLAAAGFIAGETITSMFLAIWMMIAGGSVPIAGIVLPEHQLPAIIFVVMFAILLRQLALGSGSSRRFE